MAAEDTRGFATLVIAALLILALIFSGLWIIFYVAPANNPQVLYPWFGFTAVAIVALGLIGYAILRWRG